MEAQEERLVARLRHHNPTLTVTELHIGRVHRAQKKLIIDYLNSLRLNLNVESSPGLETVVSVDISSSTQQDDIFKKLLAFIRDIGIGDVSVTSEPFDERQPEIESADSIPAVDSSSREYTPLNSEDIEDLISRDKSESEFELILSRPRRCSSRESKWLHSDQSSKDVIGSILRVSEGRSQSSGWSLLQRSIRLQEQSLASKNVKSKPQQRIQTIWSRAKSLFKKKNNKTKQAAGQFQVLVSKDSIHSEVGISNDKGRSTGCSIFKDIKAVKKPKQVSLNSLQKRLEKVSRDVFSMKNKCPGMKIDGPALDAYTQTQEITVERADLRNTVTRKVDKNCSSTDTPIGRYYLEEDSPLHSDSQSLSEMSAISCSSESEDHVINGCAQVAAPQPLRGMVTNLIPVYPNMPAQLKRHVICGLKPVGAPFFFRRLTSRKSSSNSTATSCLTTTASDSVKSTGSTVTISSASLPSTSHSPSADKRIASYEDIIYSRPDNKNFSCGVATTTSSSLFERESRKKTQTVDPPFKATEINTSGVFQLPKVTQTKPKKKKKLSHTPKGQRKVSTAATQTFACSNCTSCTDLLGMKSCGTKTENEVERVDKENSCHLISKKATETKETNSDTMVMHCDTCREVLDKRVNKKRKSLGKHKSERPTKRGIGWGEFPDGNFGFGQSYAPGKVYPVFSLATGFSLKSPFNLPPPEVDKGGNLSCQKLCNMFGGKKRALLEELHKQKLELMQMRMILVAINEELLAECSDSSSDEYIPSSDDTYPSDSQVRSRQCKKVTFRNPLVNERTLNNAND